MQLKSYKKQLKIGFLQLGLHGKIFCKLPINLIEEKIKDFFTLIGNSHFIIISSFLTFIIEVFYIALFIIVFVYIFKIAFLDKKKI